MWPNTGVTIEKQNKTKQQIKATDKKNQNLRESKLSLVNSKPFTDSEYLILAPCPDTASKNQEGTLWMNTKLGVIDL